MIGISYVMTFWRFACLVCLDTNPCVPLLCLLIFKPNGLVLIRLRDTTSAMSEYSAQLMAYPMFFLMTFLCFQLCKLCRVPLKLTFLKFLGLHGLLMMSLLTAARPKVLLHQAVWTNVEIFCQHTTTKNGRTLESSKVY